MRRRLVEGNGCRHQTILCFLKALEYLRRDGLVRSQDPFLQQILQVIEDKPDHEFLRVIGLAVTYRRLVVENQRLSEHKGAGLPLQQERQSDKRLDSLHSMAQPLSAIIDQWRLPGLDPWIQSGHPCVGHTKPGQGAR